jgi:hypothetical protein
MSSTQASGPTGNAARSRGTGGGSSTRVRRRRQAPGPRRGRRGGRRPAVRRPRPAPPRTARRRGGPVCWWSWPAWSSTGAGCRPAGCGRRPPSPRRSRPCSDWLAVHWIDGAVFGGPSPLAPRGRGHRRGRRRAAILPRKSPAAAQTGVTAGRRRQAVPCRRAASSAEERGLAVRATRHRAIANRLGVPVGTARGWMRGAREGPDPAGRPGRHGGRQRRGVRAGRPSPASSLGGELAAALHAIGLATAPHPRRWPGPGRRNGARAGCIGR